MTLAISVVLILWFIFTLPAEREKPIPLELQILHILFCRPVKESIPPLSSGED